MGSAPNQSIFPTATPFWIASLAALATIPMLPAQTRSSVPKAQQNGVVAPDRITNRIDSSRVSILAGQTPREVRLGIDLGEVLGDMRMPRMILTMRRSPEQQAALDAYSQALQDPKSPYFHKWISSAEFGERFGLSRNDINTVSDWLKSEGFTIDEIPAGNWSVTFSGTAGSVKSTFRTAVHYIQYGGSTRFSNITDPSIPQALDGVVTAILGLHNFAPAHSRTVEMPRGTFADGSHFLEPSDFATIYNLAPLYQRGVTGKAVKIAIIESCTVDVSIATSYWALENIAQTGPWYWNYGTPQTCGKPEAGESFLDYEWAGALAPDAQVWLVSSDASNPLFGAVQGVINNNFAPIVSLSYSDCESSYDLAWINLWQQAQTAGITGAVSSGDVGAAGCDAQNAMSTTVATHGPAVNGICASPYVVCVGGTQFNEGSNPAQYWSRAGHALNYIPEIVWNESGTGSPPAIWGASGGGYSSLSSKPSWQTGNSTAQRGVPDIAFSAAGHDGYRTCSTAAVCSATSTSIEYSDGTSAAAPSFAAMMALLVQASGGSQGSPNQTFYSLAAQPSLGIFHDVTAGNNSVNGVSGFSAGPGWDAATGLGSFDANALVANWPTSSNGPGVTLSNLEVSKTAPPSTGCSAPPAANSFLTTDGTVYLYFSATVSSSDVLSNDWLAPNGDVLTEAPWNTASGTFCFTGARLTISSATGPHLGTWQARVYDNGKQIGSVAFTVSQPSAAPAITSLSPSSATAGGGAFTLTATGTGFSSGATILWNGAPLVTSYVSASQLTASVPASLISAAGGAAVTVSVNGAVSAAAQFTINPSIASNVSRIGVLPQFAAGAGWDTAVYVTNSSASTVTIALSFIGDDGSPLAVPFTTLQQGKTANFISSTAVATLSPNTTFSLDSVAAPALAQGWVDVRSSGSVSAFAVFRYAPNGLSGGAGVTTPWEATVPLQTQLSASSMIVPYDNTGGFATGVALGNNGLSPASYNFSFLDDNGGVLSPAQTMVLPANGHTAFLIGSNYSVTSGKRGLIKITGPGLIGLGLRFSPYGTVTTVPFLIQ